MSLSNTTTIKVNWDLELRKATLKGKVNEIHLAIEKGANIHRSLKGKWTYLHLAARNKQAAALKTLIECGANINACLLYTSPSPRDGLLSRMPSSA